MRPLVTCLIGCLGASGLACGSRTELWIDRPGPGPTPSRDAGVDAGRLPPPSTRCVEYGPELSLITVTPAGDPSVGGAGSPAISGDGARVVFVSSAADLAPGDTNGELDVFLRDRVTETTTRLSVAADGTEGDDASGFRLITGRPSISADGAVVAFPSNSDLLHPEDDNGRTDIYIRSVDAGGLDLVRVTDPRFVGGDAPALSGDGRFVTLAAFQLNWAADDGIAAFQPLRVEIATGANAFATVNDVGELADDADDLLSVGVSLTQRILASSDDGRFIAFASGSRNLELAPDNFPDIFVRDMETGALTEVTEGADDESLGPALSADGRFVAFTSVASNYPDTTTGVYVFDLATGTLEPIPNAHGYPRLSADARYVTFVRERRAFVYDRATRADVALTDVPLGDDAIQQHPFPSADGCWITFLWSEGPVTQVWVARNPLHPR